MTLLSVHAIFTFNAAHRCAAMPFKSYKPLSCFITLKVKWRPSGFIVGLRALQDARRRAQYQKN